MDKRVIRGPEPYSVSSKLKAEVEEMTRQAEADVEELRVNMRWGSAQVALVKRAAALFGMPYQTYVKQAAFRQAINDLHATEALLAHQEPLFSDPSEKSRRSGVAHAPSKRKAQHR